MKALRRGGFTLTEQIVVIVVLGVLALVGIPRVADLIADSNEAVTRKRIATARAAVRIYYGDNLAVMPGDLSVMDTPGGAYTAVYHPIYTRAHGYMSTVSKTSDLAGDLDTGYIGYVTSGTYWGHIWVQCTHTDVKGRIWTTF